MCKQVENTYGSIERLWIKRSKEAYHKRNRPKVVLFPMCKRDTALRRVVHLAPTFPNNTSGLVAVLDDAGWPKGPWGCGERAGRARGGGEGPCRPRPARPPAGQDADGNTSAPMRGMYLGRADITEK
ncbi:unnamed protein product [Chrysodeixis includens]|uniref:Uncharacterized protein n=1 Tax=Chrysodeixis includens TaxID=689277 RepID=A0A9N8PYG7_CHRIL|nr:unnamed protein product [Chrysodeixis includens]